MVLVCGHPYEPVTAFLCSRLDLLKIDYRRLDLGGFPRGADLDLTWIAGRPCGSISTHDWRIEFDELSGVYFRNVELHESEEEGEKADGKGQAYPETDARLAAVLNNLPCNVLNRPVATYSNRSKPYQALLIRRFGFKIPETLVTNDPEAVASFFVECGEKVIFKSIGGVRSTVHPMTKDDFGRLELLENCPAQFQEYIAGENIRVHVIGEQWFAVRIQCEAVDYRYAGEEGYSLSMVPAVLPEDISANCIRLTKELGLALSGIDLKETPSGEYYCFEVNTSPAFLFYESPARPIIADALAQFLAQREA
ncbi:MAG: alpha-L-glutamate ligase [Verrucomicrobia bacterium]|nr:alpha-L-glutamate ligase [Verrucomicrobiota bacterium]MBV8485882.1 alpha-L-glutamate ligase [Verrucomicrobiota bacterium]